MSNRTRTTTLATAALLPLAGALATAADAETRPVRFTSAGSAIVGTLHLPGNLKPGEKRPLAVVAGSWTSVKEQMPDTYARELAARGMAALTFDFRGWGQSGDLPNGVRFKEDPAAKAEDLRAAFAFAATLPEVEVSQIHGLGICASAGYMVDATAGNALVRKVGLVAPWLHNGAIVEAVYGGKAGVAGLIAVGRAAAAKGGEIIPAAGPVGATGVLMPIGGYYYEPTRGAIPAYDNKWNQMSWEGWLTYAPVERAATFDKPLAVVHSEAAAIPEGVRAFLAGYGGTAEVTWLDNIDQFAFYDRPDAVAAAADAIVRFFGR